MTILIALSAAFIIFNGVGLYLVNRHVERHNQRVTREAAVLDAKIKASQAALEAELDAHLHRERVALLGEVARRLPLTPDELYARIEEHDVSESRRSGRYAPYDRVARCYIYPQLAYGPDGVHAIDVVPAPWLEEAQRDAWGTNDESAPAEAGASQAQSAGED